MKVHPLLPLFLIIITLTAKAQIATDGTLGRALNLPGPHYQIGADLGQQHGGNLFHSFQDFNLHSFESATFTGPNSVANIISRVTGGNPSNIDGLIRSTMANADMYLINPYGLMFGPNARLDVQGSFHASTADYLRLGNGGRFEARHPNNSLLTVAPVEAFGFLNTPVAPISVEGRGEITAADWDGGLSVPETQTLSLIGGNLDIKSGTFFKTVTLDDEGNELTEITRLPILSASAGQINLASVASKGEISFGNGFLDMLSFSQLADISVTENALVQTSGEGGGSLFIRAGQFVVDSSTLEAKTLGSQDGGVIDIRADNISLTEGSIISSRTEGRGRGGYIDMQATDSITMSSNNLANPENFQKTAISAESGIFQEQTDDNLGDAGDIVLEAKNISFQENSLISTNTYGAGDGGNLTIKASEEVYSRNKQKESFNFIVAITYSENEQAGDAGNILIAAKNILLAESNYLSSSTIGKGQGGNITLKAGESVMIEGAPGVDISSLYEGEGGGDAGHLLIEAETISLINLAELSSITLGEGNAGTITLHADTISLENSSIRMDTVGSGDGGRVILHANHLLKLFGVEATDGYGSIISVATWRESTGNAGDIVVKAQDVLISDGGVLGSSAFGAGKAGNIQLDATGTVTIVGANPAGFSSQISSDSSPMIAGIIGGEGGNITIVAERLILKDGGIIAASSIAPEGIQSRQGGNITINIKKGIELSGVNPYGENAKGFGSGIYTQSKGFMDNAGDAGSITLQAGSLMIRDGAVITSSTNNQAQGGKIEIHVKDSIVITGDASHIQLEEAAESQIEYLKKFPSTDYNQSISGIYTRSVSQAEQSGHSSHIILSAQTLIMTDNAKISTSSAGGGKAGNIQIEVNRLQLDNSAAITSESQFNNTSRFDNLAERDSQILVLGDVIEVTNVGDGKIARYINTGNLLVRIAPIYTVADMAALKELTHQYQIHKNDVVEVKNEGHGQSARFVYVDTPFADVNGWVRLNEQVKGSFDSPAHFHAEVIGKDYKGQTFESGDIIELIDHDEGGKRAPFVILNLLLPNGTEQLEIEILQQFTVPDLAAFNELTETTLFLDGAVTIVSDAGNGRLSHFVYRNNAWIAFQNFHTVPDLDEMNNALTLAKTGNIAEISDVGNGQPTDFIYSGREWLPLNYTLSDGLTLSYPTIASHFELENRAAKPGDIVSVADANIGRYEDFFYADGEWKKTISGGDAGSITITARDGVFMSNQSAITTAAVSAGGGSITLKADNLVLLKDSQITTSVQKGASDGGNLTLDGPQFLVMNNGQIIAQAHQGRGGNIRLGSQQLVKSPSSQISASSRLGIDGNVAIDSPTVNLDDFLVLLPGGVIEEAQLKGCDVDEISELSTFDVKRAGDGMQETPSSFME